MQERQLNNPCSDVKITTVQTLQPRRSDCQSNSHTLIGGWFAKKKKTLLGGHARARRRVKAAKRCCELLYDFAAFFIMCNWSEIKKAVILAIVNRTSTGIKPVTSRHRCDALTNCNMGPLTLGAGHLSVQMNPWGVNDWWNDILIISYIEQQMWKSKKLWSSQLWTQFLQLRTEAWKNDIHVLNWICIQVSVWVKLVKKLCCIFLKSHVWNQ